MKTASIKSTLWKDTWIRKLSPNEKLVWLHLLSTEQANVAGIYDIALDTISHETGLTDDEVKKALDRFEKDNKAFFRNDWIILANRVKRTYNADNDGINKGVIKVLESIPQEIFDFAGSTNTKIGHLIKKAGHLINRTGDDSILSYLNLIQSKPISSNLTSSKPAAPEKSDEDWTKIFKAIWKEIEETYNIDKAGMAKLRAIADSEAGRGMITDIYKAITLNDKIESKGGYLLKAIDKNSMKKMK